MSFAIENKTEDGFEKIILRDSSTNTSAEIIPSCGGILHAFTILHHNEWLNIIDNYENESDFANHVTSKGFKSCKLAPFACRINNGTYTFGDTNYKIEKFLLNGSALHGLIYDASFKVTEKNADEEKAIITLQHAYRGEEKGYPFNFDCIITYQLKKGNTLHITTGIINKNNGLIPIQDGWHPYFTFGGKIDDWQLEFQAKEKLEFDDAMIPTGNQFPYNTYNSLKKIGPATFDDCFTLNFAACQPLCMLRDPVKKIQLEIRPAKSYPFLQIYTPPDRKSIAIENLSAAPDAFNNAMGLITLSPGESVYFDTSYTITLLS